MIVLLPNNWHLVYKLPDELQAFRNLRRMFHQMMLFVRNNLYRLESKPRYYYVHKLEHFNLILYSTINRLVVILGLDMGLHLSTGLHPFPSYLVTARITIGKAVHIPR